MPRVIVYMTFGSHLYGTNTPQSDEDYRGVMLPDAEAVLCCRAPRTKNSSTKSGNEVRNGPDDIDTEVYALHYFLDLAYAGETVALDMLHARKEQTTCWSPIWDELHRNRHRFYTKNLKSLVAYVRKQAAKYGVKGSRVSAFREALACLKAHPDNKLENEGWPDAGFALAAGGCLEPIKPTAGTGRPGMGRTLLTGGYAWTHFCVRPVCWSI